MDHILAAQLPGQLGCVGGDSNTSGRGDMAASANNCGGGGSGSKCTPALQLTSLPQRFYEDGRSLEITHHTITEPEAAKFEPSSDSTTLDDPRVMFRLFDDQQQLKVMSEVGAELAAGILASNPNHVSQPQQDVHEDGGGDDHHISISISISMPSRLQMLDRRLPPAPVELIRAILTMCLLTLVTTISTILYQPASGVIFGHYKLAYYLVLSVILALALGEAITAYWLSRPGGSSSSRLRFGGVVLFISIFNFAGALGIAGYRVFER